MHVRDATRDDLPAIVAIYNHAIEHTVATFDLEPFTVEERVAMARETLAHFDNVRVEGFSGLLMDFLHKHDAKIILRGLRAVSDFEYEFQMAGMNRNLFPDVETLFLTPAEQYMFISATMVREIASLGGDVTPFVNPIVIPRLKAKIRK